MIEGVLTQEDCEYIRGITGTIRKFLVEHPELDPVIPRVEDHVDNVRVALESYARELRDGNSSNNQ